MRLKNTTIGNISEVVTKGTTPTTLGDEFVKNGIPFLRVQNINNGKVSYKDDILYIDGSTHQKLSRSIIKPNDVLITIAGTIGRCAVVPENAPSLNCNQAVAIIRPSLAEVFPKFLSYWLSSDEALNQISTSQVTATISNLSLGEIRKLKIPLPPLEEQRRIAAVLDKADRLRNLDRQLVAKYDQLTQSVLYSLLGSGANLTIKPEWLNTSECLPTGFIWKRLKDLCFEIMDIDHKMPKAIENGIPFISAKDLADDGRISFDEVKRISIEDFKRLSRKIKPTKGDIIYSRIGAKLGKARIVEVDFDFLVSYSCCTIRPNHDIINNKYLCCFLDSSLALRQAENDTRGIGVPDLGMDKIRNFMIPYPSLEHQYRFAEILQNINSQKSKAEANLQKSEALFNALLQRAFRGELFAEGMESEETAAGPVTAGAAQLNLF